MIAGLTSHVAVVAVVGAILARTQARTGIVVAGPTPTTATTGHQYGRGRCGAARQAYQRSCSTATTSARKAVRPRIPAQTTRGKTKAIGTPSTATKTGHAVGTRHTARTGCEVQTGAGIDAERGNELAHRAHAAADVAAIVATNTAGPTDENRRDGGDPNGHHIGGQVGIGVGHATSQGHVVEQGDVAIDRHVGFGSEVGVESNADRACQRQLAHGNGRVYRQVAAQGGDINRACGADTVYARNCINGQPSTVDEADVAHPRGRRQRADAVERVVQSYGSTQQSQSVGNQIAACTVGDRARSLEDDGVAAACCQRGVDGDVAAIKADWPGNGGAAADGDGGGIAILAQRQPADSAIQSQIARRPGQCAIKAGTKRLDGQSAVVQNIAGTTCQIKIK